MSIMQKMRTDSMNASYAASRFMVGLLDSGAAVVGTEVGAMSRGDRGMDSEAVAVYNRNYRRGRLTYRKFSARVSWFFLSQPQYPRFCC